MSMKVGLTLSGELIGEDGARFAAQFGATHVAIHLPRFSIAGMSGWWSRPTARGGALTTVLDRLAIDPYEPISDGVV